MIIRLTEAQLKTCYAYATAAHQRWLAEAEVASTTMRDVAMPPIGWRTLLELMTSDAYNVYGQRKGRRPGSLHRAIKRISHSLAHLEAHPAFSGGALPGEDGTIFIAWWRPNGGYTPYPDQDGSWTMVPEWSTVGGIRVTRWRAELPVIPCNMAGVLNPTEHYSFSAA